MKELVRFVSPNKCFLYFYVVGNWFSGFFAWTLNFGLLNVNLSPDMPAVVAGGAHTGWGRGR